MDKISTLKRSALAIAGSSILAVTMLTPAVAATATMNITAGSLSASLANATLPASSFQNDAHAVTGGLVLTAEDATNAQLGWHVTVQASAFVYTGAAAGGATNNIPATAFSLTSAALPVTVTGQASDTTAFPAAGRNVAGMTLETARQVVSATAAYGTGSYTQAIGVSLAIPSQAPAGAYVSTFTVTIVSGA